MPEDRIEAFDERLRVLKEKDARERLGVPEDVLVYIAAKFDRAQSLKTALVQVFTYASVRKRAVDLEFARSVLGRPDEELPPEVAARLSQPSLLPRESVVTEEPPAEGAAEEAPEPVAEPYPEDEGRLPLEAPEPAEATPPFLGVQSAPEVAEPLPAEPEPAEEHGVISEADAGRVFGAAPAPVPEPSHAAPYQPAPEPATVWFSPVRTTGKRSLVTRAGQLLDRAGLREAIADGDLVAVKTHFGEEGNTGFVQPMYLREVVARVRAAGGRPFLTDANTLYRGSRGNAVEHIACAIHNGFGYATVDAPVVIADGLDGRDAVDVPVPDGTHFDTVRIGSVAVHADAMVVVTHFKGHEATGFGGALKNVGMGLGCRSAKQRMHSDFRPEVTDEECTACGRCVKWCPVDAIAIGPDRVARVDYEVCYGCGECVAACAEGAIAAQWKTAPEAIQEKIVEHAYGALSGKEGKTVCLTFVTDVSPDCDCWHFSDAGVVADIGVLASTDIVAIEQAALDLVNGAAGLPGTRGEGLPAGADKFAAITGIDGTHALEYAELLGLGSRAYELRTLE